jgi:hypothetical protein
VKEPLWPLAVAGVLGGALVGYTAFDIPGAIIFSMVGLLTSMWQHSTL